MYCNASFNESNEIFFDVIISVPFSVGGKQCRGISLGIFVGVLNRNFVKSQS
jgi:hypothetical protein